MIYMRNPQISNLRRRIRIVKILSGSKVAVRESITTQCTLLGLCSKQFQKLTITQAFLPPSQNNESMQPLQQNPHQSIIIVCRTSEQVLAHSKH